jgi:hypothetical protein
MPCATHPQITSFTRTSRCTSAGFALALLTAAIGSMTGCGSDLLPAFASPPPVDAGAADLDDAGEAGRDTGPR